MDRAGRRIGIMSVVIREGRGASLLAAISQFGSSGASLIFVYAGVLGSTAELKVFLLMGANI